MMNNELKAKVSAELKAQGINASNAQIEEAIAKATGKQELTEDTLENVAGGIGPATIVALAPAVIGIIQKLLPGGGGSSQPKPPAPAPSNPENSGNGGGGYNNSNDGGKQMNNQGEGNKNDNSGTMNW